jgi:hypothetical protein
MTEWRAGVAVWEVEYSRHIRLEVWVEQRAPRLVSLPPQSNVLPFQVPDYGRYPLWGLRI